MSIRPAPAPLVTPPPPPKPAAKSVPRLEDPLAGEPAKATPEPHLPPAKGTPADLLPPDIGSDDVAPANSN